MLDQGPSFVGAIRLTEDSRPPGLGTTTEEGLKLGARLAVGLLAVPLMGLTLFARRRKSPEPEPVAPSNALAPGSSAGALPASGAASSFTGPNQAEVETALRKLTDATITKAGPAKKKTAVPPAGVAKAARAKPKRSRTAEPLGRPDERRSP